MYVLLKSGMAERRLNPTPATTITTPTTVKTVAAIDDHAALSQPLLQLLGSCFSGSSGCLETSMVSIKLLLLLLTCCRARNLHVTFDPSWGYPGDEPSSCEPSARCRPDDQNRVRDKLTTTGGRNWVTKSHLNLFDL